MHVRALSLKHLGLHKQRWTRTKDTKHNKTTLYSVLSEIFQKAHSFIRRIRHFQHFQVTVFLQIFETWSSQYPQLIAFGLPCQKRSKIFILGSHPKVPHCLFCIPDIVSTLPGKIRGSLQCPGPLSFLCQFFRCSLYLLQENLRCIFISSF